MNWSDVLLLIALAGLAITLLITDKSLSKQAEETTSLSKEPIPPIPNKKKDNSGTSSKNRKQMPKS